MLYHLVLIDDEDWILSGIQTAIDWESIGFLVTAAFHNGREAYEYIIREHPHAILTDIKMPMQDGISLVRELREAGMNQLEVVYLSGYDDFELAQSSLRLGAVDYILKPSAPEQIVEVFFKIKGRLDEKKKKEAEQSENFQLAKVGMQVIQDAIFNSILDGNEERYEYFIKMYSELVKGQMECRFKMVSMALKETIEEEQPDFQHKEQLECLKQLMNEYRFNLPKIYIMKHQFSFSLAFLNCSRGEIETYVNEIIRTMRKKTGGTVLYAESDECCDFRLIRRPYETSLKHLFHLDMPREVWQLYMSLGNDPVLKAAIEDRDQQIMLWSLKNWMLKIDEAEIIYQYRLIRRLVYSISIFYLQNGMEKESVEQLFEVLKKQDYVLAKEAIISFAKSELMVREKQNGKNVHLCQAVAKYISKNYTEDITLNELAERFYISPNYLGTLFKKNLGLGIREYQTGIRIEQADALISSGKLKLYQVAEMVGYPNYEYFRKIYYRYRGRNPSG